MAVKVIVSERCHSMGDVMRELDSTNAIQGDFILMYADTVSNANLMPILKKHRLVFTFLFSAKVNLY
jgi:translation initiation factor eIF-2B subunit epsilon